MDKIVGGMLPFRTKFHYVYARINNAEMRPLIARTNFWLFKFSYELLSHSDRQLGMEFWRNFCECVF